MSTATLFIHVILKLLDIKIILLTTHQNEHQRNKIIFNFNIKSDDAMILIIVYALTNIDLNLQKLCHCVHMMKSAHNLRIM